MNLISDRPLPPKILNLFLVVYGIGLLVALLAIIFIMMALMNIAMKPYEGLIKKMQKVMNIKGMAISRILASLSIE